MSTLQNADHIINVVDEFAEIIGLLEQRNDSGALLRFNTIFLPQYQTISQELAFVPAFDSLVQQFDEYFHNPSWQDHRAHFRAEIINTFYKDILPFVRRIKNDDAADGIAETDA
jgi:hypothetical protein